MLRLRGLREDARLKQGEVAERADIARAYLSQLESGAKNASMDTVEAIAKALGVPAVVVFEAHRADRAAFLRSVATPSTVSGVEDSLADDGVAAAASGESGDIAPASDTEGATHAA